MTDTTDIFISKLQNERLQLSTIVDNLPSKYLLSSVSYLNMYFFLYCIRQRILSHLCQVQRRQLGPLRGLLMSWQTFQLSLMLSYLCSSTHSQKWCRSRYCDTVDPIVLVVSVLLLLLLLLLVLLVLLLFNLPCSLALQFLALPYLAFPFLSLFYLAFLPTT